MISVIIPLYNKEAIIAKSLSSVLSQDFDDFEVVVVNDGSTDRSAEIVRSIDDSRLRLIEQENGGPSKARNTGVRNARGEWILFLDADDEMSKGALKTFVEYYSRHADVDMFMGEVEFTQNGERIKKQCYKEGIVKSIYKAQANYCLSPLAGTFILRRDLALAYPYDESIRRFEDMDFLLRIYKKVSLFLIPNTLNIHNCGYAEASKSRPYIKEDYVGHLVLEGNFWKHVCIYQMFFHEHKNYEEQCKKLYPSFYNKRGLYFFCIFLNRINSTRAFRKLWLKAIGMDIISFKQ